MIKYMILDIDGVLIGEKIGFNAPFPHPDVINALRYIRDSKVPISLCTAKPYFAIEPIVRACHLDCLHITDGGSVISDPIHNTTIAKYTIPLALAKNVIEACITKGIYTEYYAGDDYFIQSNQQSDVITRKHITVLQKDPISEISLQKSIQGKEITKIMPVVQDSNQKDNVIKICKTFESDLTLSWGFHPIASPLEFGIITPRGISKKESVIAILQKEDISFENVLAVGDSTSDWQFIQLAGYKATLANGTEELKKYICQSKENTYIGPSVDDNGIIDICRHFSLL